jgi:O-antigen/teichoic acid export membrane protein
MKSCIFSYIKERVYKDSIFLISSRIFVVLCGFLFWKLAANYYSIYDMGVVVAIMASLETIILLSRFGFDVSLLRFMPSNGKRKEIFNTCLLITTFLTIVISVAYIFLIKAILTFQLLFIILAIVFSITNIIGNAFISLSKSKYYFFQSLFLSIRVPLLIPFVVFQEKGIIYSIAMGYLICSIISLVLMQKLVGLKFAIDLSFVRKSFGFSFINYISNLLFFIPTTILPIIIFHFLGAEEAALYYIAFAVCAPILAIPEAFSVILLVDGSKGTNIRKAAFKALEDILILLIPAILLIFLFGESILSLFGEIYIEAFGLLKIVAISSPFVAIYFIYNSVLNIKMLPERLVLINGTRFILLILFNYIFIFRYGIMGAGYAWFLTYLLLSICMIGLAKKMWGTKSS